ncbi:MAG TPA: PQQ-binding-like beta-propeller repeat protein, partial [Bryobacterales bacterium]|nr:PQQ-binding-like beta-propeller repeat protein [Bryobacterales bacterium]
DPQRSGWALEENTLSPANVSQLRLLWKAKVDNQYYSLSALTAPVVAVGVSTRNGDRPVVYVAGISGTVFALDALTGEELWNHPFHTVALPGKGLYQGTFLCPNGITATPVIDKSTSILYVIASDGALYGLDLGSGRVRFGPVQWVAPFAKSWSLNLVDGTVYTTLSQGCGTGLSGIYAIDVRDRHHPVIHQMLLSNTNTAGIWGRGGPVIGNNGKIYGGTADGKFDPIAGDYSNSVVAISNKDLSLADYFLPPNWVYLDHKDFDLGSASPVWFGWKNRNLLAGGFKEGVIYLMDADDLGGKDHQTPLFTSPRLGNDKAVCCEGLGIWGGLSTARDEQGQTWLYAPLGGPPAVDGPKFPVTNGENPHGSILAFKVVADSQTHDPILDPAWISGDFDKPDPVVIANGVVFALSTGADEVQRDREAGRLLNTHAAVLKALDAKTGKELYNSGNAMTGWVHFSGLAVADGRIYAVDHDSHVYCFGLSGKSIRSEAP